jgi:hypothetical protein
MMEWRCNGDTIVKARPKAKERKGTEMKGTERNVHKRKGQEREGSISNSAARVLAHIAVVIHRIMLRQGRCYCQIVSSKEP